MESLARESGLWRSDRTLANVVDTWVHQPGYPVISTERTERGTLKLTQKRFLHYEPPGSHSAYVYDVPLSLYVPGEAPSASARQRCRRPPIR